MPEADGDFDDQTRDSKLVSKPVEKVLTVHQKPAFKLTDEFTSTGITSEEAMIKATEQVEQQLNGEIATISAEEATTACVNQLETSGTSTSKSDLEPSKLMLPQKQKIMCKQQLKAPDMSLSHYPHEQLPKKRKVEFISTHSPSAKSFTKEDKLQNVNGMTGFTTASNKPLKCSSEALEKAKLFFEKSIEESNDTTTVQNILGPTVQCGFRTASNKTMSISNRAFEKANLMFANLDKCMQITADRNLEGNNKETPKKLAEIDKTHLNVLHTENTSCRSRTDSVGFKTASNKALSISSTAWKKGQNFMKAVEVPTNDMCFSPLTNDSQPAKATLSELLSAEKQNVNPALSRNFVSSNNPINRRLSFAGTSCHSPLLTTPKAKRRNSLYRPPRKRTPLLDLQNNVPKPGNSDNHAQHSYTKNASFDAKPSAKKQLGVKRDQENQIFVSDESLVKAVAMFEQV